MAINREDTQNTMEEKIPSKETFKQAKLTSSVSHDPLIGSVREIVNGLVNLRIWFYFFIEMVLYRYRYIYIAIPFHL